MSRIRLFFNLFVILGLALPALGQPPAPPKRVGKVLQIQGKNLMSNRNADGKWYKGYEGMVSHLEERLKTDAETQAIIEFFIGGQAAIKKGTEIEIVGDRKVETVGNKLLIKSGTVWAKVSKQQSKLQIETAGGTMGIEGTEFVVSVNDDGETELSVLEGAVAFTDNAGNDQMVEPGDQVVAGVKDALRYNRVGVANLRASLREKHPELAEASYYLGRFGYGTHIFRGRGGYAAYRIIQAIDDPAGAAFDVAADYTPGGLGGFVRRAKPKPAEPVKIKEVEQDGPPKFNWEKTKAHEYMVLLARDPKGTDIIWYGKTQDDNIRYPAYGPAIKAGLHYLFVIPLSDKGKPMANKNGYLGDTKPVTMTEFSPSLRVIETAEAKEGTTRPEFSWSKVDGAASYRVDMSPQQNFEDIVWSGKTDERSVDYPAEARPLEAGDYFFRVTAFDESGYKMAESAPVGYASKGWTSEGLQASK